jgi:hypothetical protein
MLRTEGISTLTIGFPHPPIILSTSPNGALTGGLNEKPKSASITTSVSESRWDLRAERDSDASERDLGEGRREMWRFWHWVRREERKGLEEGLGT